MESTFKNTSLLHGVNELLAIRPLITPEKGRVGGHSIDYVSSASTNTSESLLYSSEEDRNHDFNLLQTLLSKQTC